MFVRTAGMICFFVCLMTSLFAENQERNDKKYYCSPEQIELTDSMICVYLNEGTVEIDSLLVDQGGIYFFEDMMRCLYCRRPLNPKNTCERSSYHSYRS